MWHARVGLLSLFCLGIQAAHKSWSIHRWVCVCVCEWISKNLPPLHFHASRSTGDDKRHLHWWHWELLARLNITHCEPLRLLLLRLMPIDLLESLPIMEAIHAGREEPAGHICYQNRVQGMARNLLRPLAVNGQAIRLPNGPQCPLCGPEEKKEIAIHIERIKMLQMQGERD